MPPAFFFFFLIIETTNLFFETANKIDKPLGQAHYKEKREKQISKIRNKKEEISIDTTEIQKKKERERILWTSSTNKFDNLEEMDNFLETHSPPKLNKE